MEIHLNNILNQSLKGIMERTFDIDGRRILLKFHREKGQIFCKTVEFFEPQERALVAQTTLTQISQTKRCFVLVSKP